MPDASDFESFFESNPPAVTPSDIGPVTYDSRTIEFAQPPTKIVITGERHDDPLVTIDLNTGKVTVADWADTDEAAEIFWTALQRMTRQVLVTLDDMGRPVRMVPAGADSEAGHRRQLYAAEPIEGGGRG